MASETVGLWFGVALIVVGVCLLGVTCVTAHDILRDLSSFVLSQQSHYGNGSSSGSSGSLASFT